MAGATRPESGSSLAVLTEGGRLFLAGLPRIFPWILAAELIPLLPFANPPSGMFTTDLSLFADPGYLARAVLMGALQAFFYALAVLKLVSLEGKQPPGSPAS